MRFPLVTLRATPPMTNDIANVVISALILKTVTMSPLTSPTTNPVKMAAAMASTGEWCAAISPATTVASPYVAPTERSIPPATSTNVPAAAMQRVAACWSRMLIRFVVCRNGWLVIERITKRMAKGMKMPAIRHDCINFEAPARSPTRPRPSSSSTSTSSALGLFISPPQPATFSAKAAASTACWFMSSPLSSAEIRP